MNREEFMEWVRATFDVPGCAQRMMENILGYVEKLPEEEHYAALTDLLDGTIGLTDAEIRQISLWTEVTANDAGNLHCLHRGR